jgi:hypothetical protein
MYMKHEAHAPDFICDHQKCAYETRRKDHYREHLEAYHKEDLPRSSKQYSSKWWAERKISENWWRCQRCLKRVDKGDEWRCPNCSTCCNKDRIDERDYRFGHTASNTTQSESPIPITTDHSPQANNPYSGDEKVENSQSNIPLAPVATTSTLPTSSQDKILCGWEEEVVMLETYVDNATGEDMYILVRNDNGRIETRASEWFAVHIRLDGCDLEPCFTYMDQSGKEYWTRTFDVKGKGKR